MRCKVIITLEAGLWGCWQGRSPMGPQRLLLPLWEVSARPGSGPDVARGAILAVPVENEQRAQRDEDQARQRQAEDVALGVVRGARACAAARERGGQRPARSASPPVLGASNLQSGAENATSSATLEGPAWSRLRPRA